MAASAEFIIRFQERSSIREQKSTLAHLDVGYYNPDNLKTYQNHVQTEAAVSN